MAAFLTLWYVSFCHVLTCWITSLHRSSFTRLCTSLSLSASFNAPFHAASVVPYSGPKFGNTKNTKFNHTTKDLCTHVPYSGNNWSIQQCVDQFEYVFVEKKLYSSFEKNNRYSNRLLLHSNISNSNDWC